VNMCVSIHRPRHHARIYMTHTHTHTGGPYREYFSDICRELFSSGGDADDSVRENARGIIPTGVSLFVQCANKQVGVGDNRDKYVPKPSSTSPKVCVCVCVCVCLYLCLCVCMCETSQATGDTPTTDAWCPNIVHIPLCIPQDLSRYRFLGRIMGIGIRTNVLMPMDLTSICWKPLLGLPVTLKDLEGVDASFTHGVLDMIHDMVQDSDEKKFDRFAFFFVSFLYVCYVVAECVCVRALLGFKCFIE